MSERSSAAAQQGGLSGVEVRVDCLYFVAPVLRQCTHVSDCSESSKATASCETESKPPPPLVALVLRPRPRPPRPARRWRSLLAARTHYLASSSFDQASPSPPQPRPHLDEMADVPSDLKAVSPYLARARELTKAEPVIAYWCASSPSPHRPGSPWRAPLTRPPPPPPLPHSASQARSTRSSRPCHCGRAHPRARRSSSTSWISSRRCVCHQAALAKWGTQLTLSPPVAQSKAANASNEAFTDDVAASAYIENFGLKLFSQADNEDRKGKATRCALFPSISCTEPR